MNRLLLISVLALMALAPATKAAAATVMVTLPPLAGMVQLLLPDAQPRCLLAGNGDPHHLVLSPRKIAQMRRASLLVRSSGDDGGWSGLRGFGGRVVDLWPRAHHPWLLPSDLLAALPRLAKALMAQRLLSEREAAQRLAAARERLQRLDRAWRQALRPLREGGVIMQHPAWRRLFAHYRVPVRAVLERGHHGDGASPRQLEAALALLRGAHPPLLVVEQSHANRMIDWLSQRVPRAGVVALDALGRCGVALDSLQQRNLRQLRQLRAP